MVFDVEVDDDVDLILDAIMADEEGFGLEYDVRGVDGGAG